MDEYRSRLIVEFWMNLIPLLIICLIFVVLFFLLPKLCEELECCKWLGVIRMFCVMLILTFSVWGYCKVSPLWVDIKNDTFLEYYGEIEYQEGTGDRYSNYYNLEEINERVDSLVTIESNIRRCEARVVYAEHSKKAVAIEVYTVLETHAPIDIR